MGMRVHTADAPNLGIAILSPSELVEKFGEEFEDVTGDVLVIEDSGNQEAWVIVGTAAELAQLFSPFLTQSDDRCDYCGKKLGACDYMGLAHPTEHVEISADEVRIGDTIAYGSWPQGGTIWMTVDTVSPAPWGLSFHGTAAQSEVQLDTSLDARHHRKDPT